MMMPQPKRVLTFFVTAMAATGAASSLKPWAVLRLATSSLPDRPGTESQLSSSISIEIADTNDYAARAGSGTENTTCVARWSYAVGPYDQVYICTAVPYGAWSFSMEDSGTAYSSPIVDFVLRFRLQLAGGDGRGQDVFEGAAHFAVGDNMSGLCSAGGICSFRLKDEMTPFYINQTKT